MAKNKKTVSGLALVILITHDNSNICRLHIPQPETCIFGPRLQNGQSLPPKRRRFRLRGLGVLALGEEVTSLLGLRPFLLGDPG